MFKTRPIFARAALLGLAAALILPGIAAANLISFFEVRNNVDFVAAGFGGMRDNGTGSITIGAGVANVSKAYLYWQGPTNDTAPSANATVSFRATNVTGTFIGHASDNCWGFDRSAAYVADVTSLVTGTGTYALANFTKQNNQINVNGATLYVFYDDGNANNNRNVYLFHGNDSNIASSFDPAGWQATLSNIMYNGGGARITMTVSDGQPFPDGPITINNTPLPNPVRANDWFDGSSVPHRRFVQSLWDIRTFDITSLMVNGNNNLNLNVVNVRDNDCISLVSAAVSVSAGLMQAVPEPSTLAIGGFAVLGMLGYGWRRRK